MPRHDGQYVPTFETIIVACADCEGPLEVPATTRSEKRCTACKEARLVANMREISQRSGPAHERRLAGYARMLEREGWGSK